MKHHNCNKILQILAKYECPLCKKKKQWHCHEHVKELREFHEEGSMRISDSKIIPLGVADCKNCGYVVLLNAPLDGIITGDYPNHEHTN